MQLQLESTTRLVEVNGVPARIWTGETASGIPVIAFVTRIAVQKDLDQTQFEREPQECKPPTEDVSAFPLRMIL